MKYDQDILGITYCLIIIGNFPSLESIEKLLNQSRARMHFTYKSLTVNMFFIGGVNSRDFDTKI
jgi:hypothetical protein